MNEITGARLTAMQMLKIYGDGAMTESDKRADLERL